MSDVNLMAEASHTPGPWEAKHIDANHLVIESQTGSVAKTLIPLGLNDVAATVRANACLIAAAPDLLESLKDLLHRSENEGWAYSADEREAAVAAIAKAEGRS